MRISVLILCLSSLTALAGLSSEEKGALKGLNHYYVRVSAVPSDERYLDMACPKRIGMALNPTGEELLVMDATRGKGDRLWDPEISYSWYAGRFEKLNGPDTVFTTWNQFSDGFSRPKQDPLFRNAQVRFSMKLALNPTRLTQTLTLTPYTLGLVRWGKPRVIETRLTERPDQSILFERLVDARSVRACEYQLSP